MEISAPPMNLLGPELVRDLVALIQRAEADEKIQMLVFKSADRDYFISHVDVTRIKSPVAAPLNTLRDSWAARFGARGLGFLRRLELPEPDAALLR